MTGTPSSKYSQHIPVTHSDILVLSVERYQPDRWRTCLLPTFAQLCDKDHVTQRDKFSLALSGLRG